MELPEKRPDEATSKPPTARLRRPGLLGPLDRLFPALLKCLISSDLVDVPLDQRNAVTDYLTKLEDHIKKMREKVGLALPDSEREDGREGPKKELPYSRISSVGLRRGNSFDEGEAGRGNAQRVIDFIRRLIGSDPNTGVAAATLRRVRLPWSIRDPLRAALDGRRPLLLLGEPGSGKTMSVQELVLQVARRERHRSFPIVPIYIPLRDFQLSKTSPGESLHRDFEEHLVCQLRKEYGREGFFLASVLANLADTGRLLLVLDGVDEMSPNGEDENLKALRQFIEKYSNRGARIVLTSRLTHAAALPAHRRRVLLPMRPVEIRRFLRYSWQNYVEFPVVLRGESLGPRDLEARLTREELRFDARNPFELRLLCVWFRCGLHQKKPWPPTRPQMLDNYLVQRFKHQCDREPGLREQVPDPDALLQRWSYLAHACLEEDSTFGVPLGTLADLPDLTDQDGLLWSTAIDIGVKCGVLEHVSDRSVRFTQQRLLEHFAAKYLSRMPVGRETLARYSVARWKEVLVNLALIGGPGGTALVRIWEDDLRSCNAHLERRIAEATAGQSEKAPSEAGKLRLDYWVGVRWSMCLEAIAPTLRQAGPDYPELGTLSDLFRSSVRLLLEHGGPSAQCRALLACKDLTEWDLREAMDPALSSPARLIRNQALSNALRQRSGPRLMSPPPEYSVARNALDPLPQALPSIGSSELARQISSDLARGRFLSQATAYWGVCRTTSFSLRCFAAALLAAGLHVAGVGLLAYTLFTCIHTSRLGIGYVVPKVIYLGQHLDNEVHSALGHWPMTSVIIGFLGIDETGTGARADQLASAVVSASAAIRSLYLRIPPASVLVVCLLAALLGYLRGSEGSRSWLYLQFTALALPFMPLLLLLGWRGELMPIVIILATLWCFWRYIILPTLIALNGSLHTAAIIFHYALGSFPTLGLGDLRRQVHTTWSQCYPWTAAVIPE